MKRPAIDDARATRIAEVQSELVQRLSPVRGDLSDEKFARMVNLISAGMVRAEYDRLHPPSSEIAGMSHGAPGI